MFQLKKLIRNNLNFNLKSSLLIYMVQIKTISQTKVSQIYNQKLKKIMNLYF